MKFGVLGMKVAILLAVVSVLMIGCGPSSFEQGQELFNKGLYERAIPLLEKAKEDGEQYIKAEEMIRQAKVKMEEEADADCVRRAENYLNVLGETKTVGTWDKIVEELKAFKCRKLNAKPYVDKAYYRFIAYLAEWDAYPQAVEKFCQFTGCETQPPHILIREEELTITDDKGKEKEEVIQQEIPIAEHSTAVKMFQWLSKKDPKNGRWFDRYAKFLYDNERYQDALDAYKAISEIEELGYEVKSRAKLAAEHLMKGGRRPRMEGEKLRFFWIEDVKKKSKLKALRKDLEKARKEREQAEQKENAGNVK